MSCQPCVAAVIRGLNNIGGLKEEKADLGKGEAFFENMEQVRREKVGRAIEEAGSKMPP